MLSMFLDSHSIILLYNSMNTKWTMNLMNKSKTVLRKIITVFTLFCKLYHSWWTFLLLEENKSTSKILRTFRMYIVS